MIRLKNYRIKFKDLENRHTYFDRRASSPQQAIDMLVQSHDESWRDRIVSVMEVDAEAVDIHDDKQYIAKVGGIGVKRGL